LSEREGKTKNEFEGAAAVVFSCVGENGKNPNFGVLSIPQCGPGFILGLIKNLGLDPSMKYPPSNVVKIGPDRPVQPVGPGTGPSTGPDSISKPVVRRTG
jgi:hypothetical protein